MSGRPAVAGPLLRTGMLRDFNALGSVGSPVFASAPQLRATIRRQLGEDVAALMAIPQINERGDTIDWYAEKGSMVVPWSSASFEEKQDALPLLQAAREKLLARATQLAENLSKVTAPSKDQEVFIRLLPFGLQIPDDGHIYLVDGLPVVTFWGFTHINAPSAADTIRDLVLTRPAPPPVAPVAAAAAAAVPPPVVEEEPRRPWWRWLLWLLPLLLLLLLLLFLLRGCATPVVLDLPGIGPLTLGTDPEKKPDLPVDPKKVVPGMVLPDVVPGTVIPGVGIVGPDGTVLPDPKITAPDLMPDAKKPQDPKAPDVKPDPQKPDAPKPPETKPQDQKPPEQKPVDPKKLSPEANPQDQKPVTPPKPDQQANQKPVDPKKPGQEPLKPLVLPPDAGANGNMDFLNGKWRSRTGLVDSATGLPVEMEYTFENGKGTAAVTRHDGTVCQAPAQASMQGKQMQIDLQDAVCPDGGGFGKAKVDCVPGADGRASCKGTNSDGSKFDVVIGQ
ncbi:SrfA family protein [Novispirillum itersonii]|uniref:SrfA family protein n=1 Tax=Novispirillum itersonii TaxID=189 RepID=UPI0012DEBA93|nr:SrfA family protein [Novispirillum itersonii]